ncbi:exosortase A system-associated hydrolase 1 [Arsukibacterium tuosuense]|uniref:Exosortase A system-associated hydrolase 1 n=1 Tax=Arsukibacterium tuosuense TaxID=1323745 RepID=A0A285IUE1_9GAMM|nr:hydrolase 1, exosortase A system-associated [Arsukibacterium tuosuense]SNY51650.1 exosortase A system-associated hydrolase 1 [Arsukibacterium tuosuense]
MFNERPVRFIWQDTALHGIYSHGDHNVAVLIVVGGPQYRVGSHRQFVKLSRALADAGISSLRFDFSGMGDSNGELQPFYANAQAIKLAVDELIKQNTTISKVVIWGLCDAASAALLYNYQQPDSRIAGLVLLNPWVRQQHSHAQVMLKHYYWQRLSSKAFWRKLLGGGLNPLQSLKELLQTYKTSKTNQSDNLAAKQQARNTQTAVQNTTAENYVQQMLAGWQRFAGSTLVITSGNDHTAQEFLDLCRERQDWQQCLHQAQHQHIAAANHTFASGLWRGEVEQRCIDFIKKLESK